MTSGKKIVGTKKAELLRGSAGDDTIDGGAGNDTIYGGAADGSLGGNDVYIFGAGYGVDEIVSNHQTREPFDNFTHGSRVLMKSDVLAKDVKLDVVRVMIPQEDAPDAPQWNLKITLKGGKDSLIIDDYLSVGQDGRGEIQFADGTVWTYSDVISKVASDADYKSFAASNPVPVYLSGHAGKDTLQGSSKGEYIDGGAGNDVINALGGNDSVFGGLGSDTIDAGSGDDYVRDIGGNNLIYGGDGNDRIFASDGDDTIFGGDGADEIDSGSGSDVIDGGSGNDSISTQGGAGSVVVIHGGTGDDVITTYGNGGTATIYGDAGNDSIAALDGNATIFGGAGDDVISAGSLNINTTSIVTIDGGTGNDLLSSYDNSAVTYAFGRGYGSDTIFASHYDNGDVVVYGGNGFDADNSVQFGSGIKASDLKLDIVQETVPDLIDPDTKTQTWYHLDLHINGTTDTLRIDDYLTSAPETRGTINFSDGSSLKYADVVGLVKKDVDYIAFTDNLISAMAAFGPAPAASTSFSASAVPSAVPAILIAGQ